MSWEQTNIVGFDTLMAQLDALGPKIASDASVAAFHEAQYELPLTQAQVPVRSGALRDSGRVEVQAIGAGVVAAAIVYGNESVDYAAAVHEDLEAKHPNGKAKYVEDPVRDEFNSGRAASRMFVEIMGGLGV